MTTRTEKAQKLKQYLDSFATGKPNSSGISLEEAIEYLFLSPSPGLGLNQFAYTFNMVEQTVEWVRGVKTVLGYDEETFDFQVFHQAVHPDDLEKMMRATLEAAEHVIQKKETHPLAAQLTISYRIQKANGEYIHIQDATSCLSVDSNGMPLKGVCVCTNISPVPFTDVTAHLSCPCSSFTTFQCLEESKSDFRFTKRELEIMKYIGEGKSSEEIGKKLFISKYTVDKHRSNILKKAGVKRTQELIQFFIH